MHWIDWTILVGFTAWIVFDGVKRTKDSHGIEGYFLANRSIPWWAAGISVMATQLSAITMIGTTGQGYNDGMRFIQFYYALPVAMIILSVTLVPFFYRSGVYTAYEYLERRFDAKTRSLTGLLFLLSRGMSVGAVVSAPAVVLSLVLGWSLTATALTITMPAVVYTMFGGVQAVTWTDVKIMVLIIVGLFAVIAAAVFGLPAGIGLDDGLSIAAATGSLRSFDFSWDLTNPYTFWSGTIAALFLFCSYFGTDQSQVQRYLTAKSIDDARTSLFMSAYWKIPLQALVMIIGVFMFLFYLFTPPPMLFNRAHDQQVRDSARAGEYASLEQKFGEAVAARKLAAEQLAEAQRSGAAAVKAARSAAFNAEEQRVTGLRSEAVLLVKDVTGDSSYNDINYVFPTFIVTHLPVGLIGLLMAAIFAAAMSTVSGELSALSTSTVIDFYRRWVRDDGDQAHLLWVSKLATLFWALFASIVAIWASELGSLIEVVNRFGSFFYGSILGVFLLAIGWQRANSTGAFVGLLAGMGVVAWVTINTSIAFLWHNLIGAVVVFVVGMVVSELTGPSKGPSRVGTNL